jgi:hypothetical protein
LIITAKMNGVDPPAYRCPRPCRSPSGSSIGRNTARELDAGVGDLRSIGMTTRVNNVHHVTTFTQVAKDLGER